MAALSTRVRVTFRTRYGLEFSLAFFVAPGVVDPTSTAVQAIVTAINNITTAVAFRIELSAVDPHLVTPSGSAAYVNEDKAEFIFRGQGGLAHTFKVPGLKASILGADNETIDATSGAGLAFANAVATYATGAGGEAMVQPKLGRRRAARKTLKK